MDRREFLNTFVTGCALVPAVATPASAGNRLKAPVKLETFGYAGVRLLPSMFSRQLEYTRARYYEIPNDNILKGFREQAGLRAPGFGMDGWCSKNCIAMFGQWLSGMARIAAATNDDELRDKALVLARGWTETTKSGVWDMDTYGYEKTVCGLVDLALYADYSDAWPQLERLTEWASRSFDRSRSPGSPMDRDGRKPKGTLEWYTLPENLYRAYVLSGNSLYKEFGDVWRYDTYWDEFVNSTNPPNAKYLHSYSHCNTFNSAAMTWAVTGEDKYLKAIRNAYDYFQKTQIYASGGYGPGEWSVPNDGSLGKALDFRSDSAEIPCGSWGAFKLSKYLQTFTGEARYGDWIERLLYNGIGAALPVEANGNTFYYADYRLGMAQKEYYWDHWPCCSGTYIQAVADYHDLIYYRDADGLYVNLFVPSEATWMFRGQQVTVRQQSSWPESDSILFLVNTAQPVRMALRFRVPRWARKFQVVVNGENTNATDKPGEWASVERTWQKGDHVTIVVPPFLRTEAVDSQHPQRAAVLFGPLLLAQNARYTLPLALNGADISSRLQRKEGLTFHATETSAHEQKTGSFLPFYSFGHGDPYRVYFDMDDFRFL